MISAQTTQLIDGVEFRRASGFAAGPAADRKEYTNERRSHSDRR